MSRIGPVLWLLTAATIIGSCIGVSARAEEPCYLPHGIPARVPPAGMGDDIWPPCEPVYHQWQVPVTGSQPLCPTIDGTPNELWCIYTDPGNGKQYAIGRGINQRIQ